ncbi:hypothetical protein VP1G_01440 [Cytospora mali]|uniref:RNA polymerase-associated protein LEO1 n=1 Tax=Cytospora mali TaxID=578113 RepID=A0A194UQX0_CYTMA|nr:hypothetical protein VP1G_01440 [Valsa mali var. pyri (nom. inval.)]
MSDLDERVDVSDGGGDDLFGDGGSDDGSQIAENDPILSDDDLASDHGRQRSEAPEAAGGDDDAPARELRRVMEMQVSRHGLPKTKDGNMQMAKVPNFLRVIPEEYKADEFQPSGWAIENSKRKIPINLLRYRRNPETGELESNTNIYRWSDGSLTIQVGEEHYDIQVKDQIPPPNKPYVADRDAHRYFAAAHMFDQQMLTVGHISEEWTIRPDKQRVEEDTELLREQMSRARPGMKEGEMIITTTQDPELQKKQAEMAEKERIRAQRRRENAQARMDGGGGGGGYRRGGLSIDALEGGRRSTAGRKRGPGGGAKRGRGRGRGGSDYDSDDDLPSGAHGQNEYDREDDFIASSDDEAMESGENNDEEEEGDDILDVVDREQDERPRAKRQRIEHSDADDDADGDPEDSAAAHASADHARRHRRRVVDDDDDDE